MNERTPIRDPQALSDTLMTEERAYMAKWLALEVLMNDETVCDDEDLFGKLAALQEKWKQETLTRRGIVQSVAGDRTSRVHLLSAELGTDGRTAEGP